MNYGSKIKDALQNYKKYKRLISLNVADDGIKEVVEFIDRYMQLLDAEQRDVLKAIYFERKNISRLAKQGFYARSTFYYKAEKIVQELAETYQKLKS